MKALMAVTQRDGSVWAVETAEIARSRAEHYKSEFGGDLERSLAEDTLPLFEGDEFEIFDWAKNDMNWSDFRTTHKVRDAEPLTPADFQKAWNSDGECELIDKAIASLEAKEK